jgi:hypothetical protein
MRARLGTMAVLIGLGLTTLGVAGVKAQEGPPPPGFYNQPWTQAPGSYRDDISRRGFHDGIEGARKDFQNHRPPNVNNRDEYRHPSVGGSARHAYRQAFAQGYQVGVQRIYNGRGTSLQPGVAEKGDPHLAGLLFFGGHDRLSKRDKDAQARAQHGKLHCVMV